VADGPNAEIPSAEHPGAEHPGAEHPGAAVPSAANPGAATDVAQSLSAPPPAPAGPWDLELRGADGRHRGLHDLHALRAMIYTGSIDARAKVRAPPPGGAFPPLEPGPAAEWISVAEVPPLREVMDLIGLDLEPDDSERRIGGWQRSGGTEDAEHSGHTQSVSQVMEATREGTRERLPVLWLIVGTVLLVLVFLVVGLVLS